MENYKVFLKNKRIVDASFGKNVSDSAIHPMLFPFQRDIVRWAVKKGRAAVFADTGLGKTHIATEWARLLGEKTLIVSPLSVAKQTVLAAGKTDTEIKYVRSQKEVATSFDVDLFITNYEMLDAFDSSFFGAVVLDESSILKSFTGKIRTKLIDKFSDTPYRLCCTATPAPNDIAELSNHSAFLGVLSRENMLSTFFVHDDKGWRLRGHAEEAFFRWLSSWAISLKKPSDLGFEDDGFILPPLNVTPVFVSSEDIVKDLFSDLGGIQSRSKIRRETLKVRVSRGVEIIESEIDKQWIVWCGLNDESSALSRLVEGSVEVKGSDSLEYKICSFESFVSEDTRILVTKPRIAGFGMNFQNASRMVFVGLSDSFESYYQCIRRSWRYLQDEPVDVYIVLSERERGIWENVKRKEREAEKMSERLVDFVKEAQIEELSQLDSGEGEGVFQTAKSSVITDSHSLFLGDSVEKLKDLEADYVDFSVFSPPFLNLYTYTPSERDVGNSLDEDTFFEHFSFIISELLRITKPGRICAVHTADVPALLSKDGFIGLKDFPGKTIIAFEQRGWIYHGRVTIDKNPQAQAIRTHSKALLFVQFEKDSSWSRPAIGDYVLLFRKPGENAVPVLPVENGEMTRDLWIEWAHPVWYGIRESDTLQHTDGRAKEDDKHICPLQLGTIERCIKLWSNPGEVVLSPFAGIGSEVYQAVKLGRYGIGIELKESYFAQMVQNMRMLDAESRQQFMF